MTKPSPEIEALVKRLFAARASGDSDAVLNLFSESEHFVGLGSDVNEWWLGQDAVSAVRDSWADRPEHSDTVVRVEAFENGSTGWAAVEGRRVRPGLRPYGYYMSLVLQLEAGAWRVVYVHFAVGVSNEEMNRVDLTPGLSSLLDSLEQSAVVGEGAVRTGTVMFTDVVGSTAASQAMGDQAWTTAIKEHITILREIVEACGGRMVKSLGDGAMFLFTSGSSALDAAMRIQESLTTQSESGVRVRIGVHTGDLIASDDDLVGLTVHKAARVASAAQENQILVSATTAGMVNHNVYRFGTPLSAELRGLDGKHVLLPLTWGPDLHH